MATPTEEAAGGRYAPLPGEDGAAVLREFGLSDDDIADLAVSGTLLGPEDPT